MYELWQVGQVAVYLQVRRTTVYRWIKERGLPAFKVGTRWRFRQVDVDEWLFQGVFTKNGSTNRLRAGGEGK